MASESTSRQLSHVGLKSFAEHVAKTNTLSGNALDYALIGVFGEVGSLMEAAKKREREGSAYHWFRKDAREEFGDALWYLGLLCILLPKDLEGLFQEAVRGDAYKASVICMDQVGAPVAIMSERVERPGFLDSIVSLGEAASGLFRIRENREDVRQLLGTFTTAYLDALQASELSLSEVIQANVAKSASRFLRGETSSLPDFDKGFVADERLPDEFEIEITKRPDGKAVLKWNGVFIGDPLTDNIVLEDGYRYHDVFHLAHAAILGWSPVFRSLIKHKRKTNPAIDEAQDGGRAIVIEEGLTAWIFARSKDYRYFEDLNHLPYDLLKIIQQFVDGYEVADCPLWLWEEAILKGYGVFRQIRSREGGIVAGNRVNRTVTYRPLG